MAHTKKHYANAYIKKSHNGLDYESEKESKLYKKSLQGGDATVAERIAAKDRIEAKKERDRLQAQHITPRGRLEERPGPHKRSGNRMEIERLLPFVPKDIKEKVIKFAEKFDEKQHKKWKAKQTKKKMKKRAKKLSAYESYT